MLQASEKPMRRVAVAMLAALGLVYVLNVAGAKGRVDVQGDIIGCDFLAFYGAALDIRAGRSASLYDFEHQRDVQQPFARNAEWNYYYPFVNPPFYALFAAPFGALPYVPAFALWAAMSFVATAVSICWMGRALGFPRNTTVTALLVGLAFPATFMNLAGGQNAAFSLLLLTACVILQLRSRDWAAGLVLGLLLFKPQLVITVAALWLVKRRWQSLAGLAVTGSVLAGVSFALMPEASRAYVDVCTRLGGLIHQGSYETWKQNSWYGFFTLAMHPHWPTLLRVLTAAACLLTFVWLLRMWRGPWNPSSEAFRLQWAATIVATLLISPHLYMYDLAILVLPALLSVDHLRRTNERNLTSSTLVWATLMYFGLPVWLQLARLTSLQIGPLLLLAMLVVLVKGMLAVRSGTTQRTPTAELTDATVSTAVPRS